MDIVGHTHTKKLGKKVTPIHIWLYIWLKNDKEKGKKNIRYIYDNIHTWRYYKEKETKIIIKRRERELYWWKTWKVNIYDGKIVTQP